jgi:hypothetical protein
MANFDKEFDLFTHHATAPSYQSEEIFASDILFHRKGLDVTYVKFECHES